MYGVDNHGTVFRVLSSRSSSTGQLLNQAEACQALLKKLWMTTIRIWARDILRGKKWANFVTCVRWLSSALPVRGLVAQGPHVTAYKMIAVCGRFPGCMMLFTHRHPALQQSLWTFLLVSIMAPSHWEKQPHRWFSHWTARQRLSCQPFRSEVQIHPFRTCEP